MKKGGVSISGNIRYKGKLKDIDYIRDCVGRDNYIVNIKVGNDKIETEVTKEDFEELKNRIGDYVEIEEVRNVLVPGIIQIRK